MTSDPHHSDRSIEVEHDAGWHEIFDSCDQRHENDYLLVCFSPIRFIRGPLFCAGIEGLVAKKFADLRRPFATETGNLTTSPILHPSLQESYFL